MALPPLRTKVGADTAGFTSGIGAAVSSLGGFKGALGVAGTALGAFIGAKGLGAAVSAFSRFDEKMTESQAIMDDLSQNTMARMERAALQVGRTTLKSNEEAAESYFFLASAGLDAEQSIAALPQVAAFAQAGMFDMATATELATDAQSALGLVSEDAQKNLEGLTRTTDVLVAANQEANATVEQFSEALTNKLGARLRILNKDIEEGVAGLAALADQGIKGRRAGRGLSIVFRDLAREAVKSEAAFEELGVQVFDAEGNMRNLADIMSDLEDGLAGMSDKQRTAELQMLGINRRAISFLNALIGLSDEIAEYQENVQSSGQTTEVAEKQLDSLSRQTELMAGEFASATVELGEFIAEGLNLTENATLIRRALRNIREEVQGFEESMAEAFDPERADELQTSIDQVGAQFDEIPTSELQDQVAGLGQSLREELGPEAARRFAVATESAIEGVKRGRIEAERLNEVVFRRFRLIARQRAENERRRQAAKEEADQRTARERELAKIREIRRAREEAIQKAQSRRLEKRLGLEERIIAREEAKLDRMIRQEESQKRILTQAKKVAELRREGVDMAKELRDVLKPIEQIVSRSVGFGEAGAGGLAPGRLPGRLEDFGVLPEEVTATPIEDMIARRVGFGRAGTAGGGRLPGELEDFGVKATDGIDRARQAIEEGLVPALDQLAGKAFESESAIGILADALLSTFAEQFGDEEGLLGTAASLAGGFAGGFQSGGRVPAGTFGVGGEEGPEVFAAPQGGRVLSARETRRAVAEGQEGGGDTVLFQPQIRVESIDPNRAARAVSEQAAPAIMEQFLRVADSHEGVRRVVRGGGGM